MECRAGKQSTLSWCVRPRQWAAHTCLKRRNSWLGETHDSMWSSWPPLPRPSEHGKKEKERKSCGCACLFSPPFLFRLEAWQKWRNRSRKKGGSEMLVTSKKSQFGSSLTCSCNVSIGFQLEGGSWGKSMSSWDKVTKKIKTYSVTLDNLTRFILILPLRGRACLAEFHIILILYGSWSYKTTNSMAWKWFFFIL